MRPAPPGSPAPWSFPRRHSLRRSAPCWRDRSLRQRRFARARQPGAESCARGWRRSPPGRCRRRARRAPARTMDPRHSSTGRRRGRRSVARGGTTARTPTKPPGSGRPRTISATDPIIRPSRGGRSVFVAVPGTNGSPRPGARLPTVRPTLYSGIVDNDRRVETTSGRATHRKDCPMARRTSANLPDTFGWPLQPALA